MKEQELRYEIKSCYQPSDLDFLPILKSNQLSFRTSYPDRIVNNIYFDSTEYSSYLENLSGGADRTKVRYRWYGDETTPQAGQLEVKYKVGHLGGKYILPIDNIENITFSNLNDFLLKNVPEEFLPYVSTYNSAKLFNKYHRSYYESFDRNIRVTIDSRLEFYPLFMNTSNLLRNDFPELNIIEVKCTPECAKEAQLLLNNLPTRVSKFSKYVTGVSNGLF